MVAEFDTRKAQLEALKKEIDVDRAEMERELQRRKEEIDLEIAQAKGDSEKAIAKAKEDVERIKAEKVVNEIKAEQAKADEATAGLKSLLTKMQQVANEIERAGDTNSLATREIIRDASGRAVRVKVGNKEIDVIRDKNGKVSGAKPRSKKKTD